MNVRRLSILSTIRTRRAFRGITIMEVLVSMVVALIGVLGIMIMIPFSVGQVQSAFDFETANRLARNAANEFKIKGFDHTDRWVTSKPLPSTVASSTARTYMIDPTGTAARVTSGLDSGYFPFVSDGLTAAMLAQAANAYPLATFPSADKCILIERASVTELVTGAAMAPNLANWHFTWRHDPQFVSPTRPDIVGTQYPTIDLAPPQQIFDVNASGNPMRRQMLGDFSYVVLSIPTNLSPSPFNYPADADAPRTPDVGNSDVVGGFRNFVLVYKQRPAPVVDPIRSTQSLDRVYEVVHPMEGDPTMNPELRMAYSGGVIRLRTTLALNNSNAISSQREDIRRGDWIALTNVTFDFNTNRFVQQIDFYVVLDYTVDASNFGVVTIQGPDFDMQLARFVDGSINQTIDPINFGNFAPSVVPGPPAMVIPSKTYAIHLPDVWAVVERSFQ